QSLIKKGGFTVDNNTNDQRRKHKLIEYANGKSLEEINGTVEVPKGKGFWKTLLAYSGPGALVAVGYMDPATGLLRSLVVRHSVIL
ncbi:hypothetical protein NE652_10300, partial [Bifidobacterium pseudocatenulatum]|nr:hypothetical protein [Bifidobacterium pseudocatenulatum]